MIAMKLSAPYILSIYLKIYVFFFIKDAVSNSGYIKLNNDNKKIKIIQRSGCGVI